MALVRHVFTLIMSLVMRAAIRRRGRILVVRGKSQREKGKVWKRVEVERMPRRRSTESQRAEIEMSTRSMGRTLATWMKWLVSKKVFENSGIHSFPLPSFLPGK